MMLSRRAVLATLPMISLAWTNPGFAASGWDGTWTGLWGGADETSITIVDDKVVAYAFKGTPRPVETRSVDESKIVFGTSAFTITLTRLGETSARAEFASDAMGKTLADLTRR